MDFIIWCLIISGIFYISNFMIFNIFTEKLGDLNFMELFIINWIIIGIIILIITKMLKKKYKATQTNVSARTRIGERAIGKMVTVYTFDNKRYYGFLKNITSDPSQKGDIILGDVKFLGKGEPVSIGDEMFFRESNIKRLLLMEE